MGPKPQQTMRASERQWIRYKDSIADLSARANEVNDGASYLQQWAKGEVNRDLDDA
jgi:hypothetical protein